MLVSLKTSESTETRDRPEIAETPFSLKVIR
jgi:hypothetical protein